MNHIFLAKKPFHKNPKFFRNFAHFEADKEIEDSKTFCKKTTNIYKQNPDCKDYYIISELNGVLQSGFYESPLGYNKVDWFVNEVIKN